LARAIALAVAIGALVTGLILWRDADRPDATFMIAAAPTAPLAVVEITSTPRRSFALPRLRDDGRGRLMLQVGTYSQAPVATIRLEVLDSRGRRQATCRFPPSAYYDNALLRCDLPDVAHARRVVISHAPRSQLAVFATRGVVGYLAYTSSGSAVSRVRSVVDRVGLLMPAGMGPLVLIAGLVLSTAAWVLALLLVPGVVRRRPDTLLEQREPLGEPARLLAEARDDEREVQHHGEEEAESDDEEGVGRRGDPERAGDAREEGGPGGEDEQGQPGREPED
jgi:hypothetical protein